MIADNHGNLASQLADLMPVQQIDQAMLVSRYENGDAGLDTRVFAAPAHPIAFGNGLKLAREVCEIEREIRKIELHTHEEQAGFVILMLIRAQDVRAMRIEEARDGGHNALCIRTIDQQNCGSS